MSGDDFFEKFIKRVNGFFDGERANIFMELEELARESGVDNDFDMALVKGACYLCQIGSLQYYFNLQFR
jgi:hypothetical protein